MTNDQYLRMVEQSGEEIDWVRCPPEVDDFPPLVIDSLNIFHSMGSRLLAEVGYIGKDFTNFEFLLRSYQINEQFEKDYVLDLVLWLDSHQIEESQKRIKSELSKAKQK